MEGEQAEEEPVPETRIEVEIPKVSTDLGSDLYFVKLPNFLSVEPRSTSQQFFNSVPSHISLSENPLLTELSISSMFQAL